MPKVSIIIPLYNKENHIKRAIDSVLFQSMQDFEIIVIDDGSTDNGVNVVGEIQDSRIRLIRQKNVGVSVARNRGVAAANSSVVAFLDADDAYETAFLEIILYLQKRYPCAGILATAYVFVDKNGSTITPKYYRIPSFPWEGLLPNYFECALGEPPIWTSATAMPKKVFEDVGGFPIGERLGEDLDLWFRVALRYSIAFSSLVGAKYYMNAVNRVMLSGIIDPERRLKKTALLALSTGLVPPASVLFVKEYLCKKDLEIATQFIWSGQKMAAWKVLIGSQTRFFWRKRLVLFILSILPTKLILFLYAWKDKCRARLEKSL